MNWQYKLTVSPALLNLCYVTPVTGEPATCSDCVASALHNSAARCNRRAKVSRISYNSSVAWCMESACSCSRFLCSKIDKPHRMHLCSLSHPKGVHANYCYKIGEAFLFHQLAFSSLIYMLQRNTNLHFSGTKMRCTTFRTQNQFSSPALVSSNQPKRTCC